ncbi:MAG TPA: DUF2157 domain-containing protein [Panacibacter sp.]|nr:DUF2157 domain-containing protein [Panacibacter sp.]HNP43125.1 DUF2157 domain-containing protein [Panacibacter sp.]
MDIKIFEVLSEQKLITKEELNAVKVFNEQEPVSVHRDLLTALSAGILLLITGLGILIYEHIDTIGHDTIITLIALGFISCFIYCFRKSSGYSNKEVKSPNVWFDYILLLGALLLLLFIGYIQYEYNVFGNRWGMAAFIPMIILFFTGYYFDHRGILSLAITNLATWLGITVTPIEILSANDFSDERLIYSGLILGTVLIAISMFTVKKMIKEHFAFTYKNFGAHILFISLTAGMIHFDDIYILWFLALTLASLLMFRDALKEKSFYFFVITALYLFFALSYVIIKLLYYISDDIGIFYLGLIYLIASGVGLIKVLMKYNKKIKSNDSLRQE